MAVPGRYPSLVYGSMPIMYIPHFFWTGYPREKTKIWNLTKLLTPTSWILTFGSIFLVIISLKIATFVGTQLGLQPYSRELILIPFRFEILIK